VSLLETTKCQTIFRPRERPVDDLFEALSKANDRTVLELPTLQELLAPEIVDFFPWNKTYADVADESFLVLHTSGSTGNPKPVDIKHSLIASIDAQQLLPDVDNRHVTAREWANQRVYTALPPFHSAGWNFFSYSIFQFTELILGPSDAPPSLNTVELVLHHDMAEAGIMPPSLLTEAAADDTLLKMMSKWSSVTYGGGPLPQTAGDALQTKLKVLHILGSTETFNIPELLHSSEDDWPFHCYHPSLGMEFRERMHGLYELVFVRKPRFSKHQGAFCTFPDAGEYAMKDLYEKHVSKPNLWRYRGRLDDIIVLSNGEKFNPSGAESRVGQESDVKSALIVGTAQDQPALLVEPFADGEVSDEIRERIVSGALKANEVLPAHAQIHHSHVKVLETSNTFLRSSKGEVQRAPTISALSGTIKALYSAASTTAVSSHNLDVSSAQALTRSLLDIMSQELLQGRKISQDDNIFDVGFDSLQVTKLLRHVRGGLKQHDDTLGASPTPRTIYQNPSAASLSKALMNLVSGQGPSPVDADNQDSNLQSILDSYKSRLNDIERTDVIVLTGSTGSLGSYFLDSVIRKRSFAKIICLNRRGGTCERQREIHRSRMLIEDFSDVQFLEVKLADSKLGLTDQQYSTLADGVTHIFHGAWQVNFNLPMSSFRSQLDGCYRLVELAHHSVKRAAITFISSVGAANHWAYISDGLVPERALDNFAVAEPMGYAQSKLLAELLFVDANKRLGIPITVCRVGQIAGPVKSEHGAWNSSEWFPSLMLSTKALGKLPDTLGAMDRIDWLPVDLLGDMLVETVTRKQRNAGATDHSFASPPSTEFLHFVNPQHIRWSDIVSKLASHTAPTPRIVPYKDWLQALTSASEQRTDEVSTLPAMKLLDFFQDIGRSEAKRPIFSTTITEKVCSSLKACGPISATRMLLWMKQWSLDVKDGHSCSRNARPDSPSLDSSAQVLPKSTRTSDFVTYTCKGDSGIEGIQFKHAPMHSAAAPVPTVWRT
jgi:thioester reductase-like protein